MASTSCSSQVGDLLIFGGQSTEVHTDVSINSRLLVMWCVLSVMIFLCGMSLLFHLHWRAKSRQMAQMTLSKNLVEDVSKSLVRIFAPKLAVQSYLFRGMKPKDITVSLSFKELGLELPDGASVLDGVTGSFQAGQLIAIMGSSGAGKTTFLNVLCGKASYGKMRGEVRINGELRNIQDLKPVMGFVPQDDIVYENLTVREHLEYAAWLRSPRGTSAETHCGIVEDVLHVMQLEHVQLSLVGSVEERGVSGGQKKRVNIGLELAASPSLLFLDEPTSGLDSTSSLQILNSLSKMAQLGMTIIMTIHQPRYSLFQLFDSVLLLGMGGRTVYSGVGSRAVPHFVGLGFLEPVSSENPADWLMDVISGQVPNTQTQNIEPKQLSSFWDPAVASLCPEEEAASRIKFRRSDGTLFESSHALSRAIDDEWNKHVPDSSQTLDCLDDTAFCSFLNKLLCREVRLDVARDVMALIAESVDNEAANEKVTKEDIQAYLLHIGAGITQHHVTIPLRQHNDTNIQDTAFRVGDAMLEATERVADFADGLAGSLSRHVKSQFHRKQQKDSDFFRQKPIFGKQFRLEVHRQLVQYWRQGRKRLIDLLLVLVLGATTALLFIDCTDKYIAALMFQLGIAFITNISSLRVFADKTICWRESASGTNMFALYCARTFVHALDIVLQVVVYVSLYYAIALPAASFEVYLVPCLALASATSGWGYFMSTLLTQNATMASTLIVLLLCGLLGEANIIKSTLKGGILEFLIDLTVSRWSMQMFLGWDIETTGGIQYPTVPCSDLTSDTLASFMETLGDHRLQHSLYDQYTASVGYASMGFVGSGILILSLQGLLLRVLGYISLRYVHRSKQL